jgi:hypothetical protein
MLYQTLVMLPKVFDLQPNIDTYTAQLHNPVNSNQNFPVVASFLIAYSWLPIIETSRHVNKITFTCALKTMLL